MRLRPSWRDEKLSAKKIMKRSGGNIREEGNSLKKERTRGAQGPSNPNGSSVVEQMFERLQPGRDVLKLFSFRKP